MEKRFLYWDSIFLLLIAVLYFLTQRGIVPAIMYSVMASIFALFIFPGKLWGIFKLNTSGITETFFRVLSNFIIASLISLTVLYLFAPESSLIKSIMLICNILNKVCLCYFIFRSRKKEAVLCVCCLFISGYWLF